MKVVIRMKPVLFFFLGLFCCQIISAYAQDSTDIITRIRAKIAKIPITSSLTVNVTVQNGVAALDAVVATEEQAQMLVAIAASIPGIVDVDVSQLTLPNHQPIPRNTVIIGKILGTYVREHVFGNSDVDNLPINIEISNQRIFLRGVLDAKMQLVAAINIARKVSNNMQIISMLSARTETVRMSH